MNLDRVSEIIDHYGAAQTASLAVLEDLQQEYNYLPREALELAAERLDMPVGELYGMATFFKAFSLEPKGEHICKVCLGTACHVRGGPRILQAMERELGIEAGSTTPDAKFTLEAVRCVGACAMGPVVVVNGEPHAHMTTIRASRLIRHLAGGKRPRGKERSAQVSRALAGDLSGVLRMGWVESREKAASLRSYEELQRLRAQLQEDIRARTAATTTITVGMGTCGISAGAREVMDALLSEIGARNMDVHVATVGCIGMCSKEPLIDIQQGNEPRISYGNVTPAMVPRIIGEHVIRGHVVEEWVVGRVEVAREA